jgi:subtilisin family serine protease
METKQHNKKIRNFIHLQLKMWLIAITFILISGLSTAQERRDGPIPGVINIKFKQEVFQTNGHDLRSEEIVSPELRSVLSEHGFVRGEKIFRHFEAKDTLAVSRFTGEPVILLDLSRWYTIKVADTVNTLRFAEQLMELPGVEAASPEYLMYTQQVFPNDPRFQSNQQWGLYNWTNPGNDIHAPQAWEINTGRSDVIVAVVDGGVDYNHTDLDPGNRSRIIQGYDVADNNSDPMDDIPSQYGFANHGTPVAGIIGAITDNAQQVAGVMWDVKIMPVKVAHTSSPWWDPFGWSMGGAPHGKVAAGVDWARQNGADIINLSLGSDGVSGKWYSVFYNNPVTQATYNANLSGVLVVASMGNDDEEKEIYPAGFPWTMAVGASDQNDQRVSVSNWGSNYGNHIDVVAPGINYYSTRRNNQDGPFSGTSGAAPVVSGVAGLILSQSKDRGLSLTNDDIRSVIRVTADKVDGMGGQSFTKEYGYGRVNAYNALNLLSSPNIVEHGTKIGGSPTLTWDSHSHVFYRGMGTLATGVYYGVKQYKVTGQVNFSNYFESPPEVWIRDRTSKGWNYANPNMQTPWFKITNVTNSGFSFETVVYYIGYNSLGQSINEYYPATPSNVRVDYTAVGVPGTPPLYPPYITLDASGINPKLIWNGVNDANSYSIYYGAIQGTPGTIDCQMVPNYSDIGSTASTTFTDFSVLIDPNSNILACYYVTSINHKGESNPSNIVGVHGIAPLRIDNLTLPEPVSMPKAYSIYDNYPNPFNPVTILRYHIPEASSVSLIIFDVLGRAIRTLVDDVHEPGYYSIIWDATNEWGNQVSSGIYIYQLTARPLSKNSTNEGIHRIKKMILTK